ncbi:TPA: hypothetical protein EYP66_05190 [Candidatus Poribacteria bacterium]|nr:hypothetical protein [Candidatus Poribacteria bacterium]
MSFSLLSPLSDKIHCRNALRWENSQWAREHATELYQQYGDVWVAIADKQVMAVGSDPVGVRKIAARKTGQLTAEIFVEFIESGLTIYGANWT